MEKALPVIEGLNQILADSTVFYQKLRHYHWNVNGRHFYELHLKFEALYTQWALSIDAVAERILMLDGVPLHTLASILHQAKIEEDNTIPSAPAMVEALVADLRVIHGMAGDVITLAEQADDRGTANMLDGLRDAMDKDLWMFEAWSKEAAKAWT
jgi:starvation-inducible DNA-binding protein